MSLENLSAEYQHSAQLIKNRLAELRAELKKTTDPAEVWNLKRRIRELTPMLTEMNDLAELTARYYEKGYFRNEKYSANCFEDLRLRQSKANGNPVGNSGERADGSPAGYVSCVLPSGEVDTGDSSGEERKQKHREQKLAKSRSKIAPVHPLSGNGKSLIDSILKGNK